MWNARIGMAVGVSVLTIATRDAWQGAAKGMALTAQDEAEIRQLSVRYATALGLCKGEEA